MALDRGDDLCRDGARVEGIRAALLHGLQRRGVVRIAQRGADCQRRSVLVVEISPGRRLRVQPAGILGDEVMKPGRHRKAGFRQVDGRVQQFGPVELAVFGVHGLQQARHARRADRAAADDRLEEAERLALRRQEQVGRGRSRRRFAAVEGGDRAGRRVVPDEERAAAQPGRLRLDQAEHGLHGDQRVGGVAAGAQHVQAGLGGDRIGGDDHMSPGRDGLLRGDSGWGFGRHGIGCLLRQSRHERIASHATSEQSCFRIAAMPLHSFPCFSAASSRAPGRRRPRRPISARRRDRPSSPAGRDRPGW